MHKNIGLTDKTSRTLLCDFDKVIDFFSTVGYISLHYLMDEVILAYKKRANSAERLHHLYYKEIDFVICLACVHAPGIAKL